MKTSELIGSALDWAVAKCEGVDVSQGLTDDEYYSTDWAQGGPLIEREKLELHINKTEGWSAFADKQVYGIGSTPLISAMRCYVASKLGNDVEIPEELK